MLAALVAAGLVTSSCTAANGGGASASSAASSPASSSVTSSASTAPTSPPVASVSSVSSVTSPATTPPSGPAPVNGLDPAQYALTKPSEAQITAAVGKLDGIAADVMRRTGIPGMAIAVVHGGKVMYAKGFGVREVGKPDKVDPDTVFQLASVSKSIGSTCVAKAVTDGVVKWTDPVTKYLPDFKLSDPGVTRMVTIGDFYAHRSGLPGAAGDDLEGLGFDRAAILSKLDLFPLSPFRISYNYTNFGLTTGAAAVAAAAGTSWENLCAKDLYQPLGMTSTSSRYADYLARQNRATIHARVGDHDFEPKYIRDADAQSPAGGVSSSVNDLSKWLLMNLASGRVADKQLIDPAALLAAHTPQVVNHPPATPDSRSAFYGYGFNVDVTSTGEVKWSHSGAFYVGAGTAFSMLPADDVGIVVLTNAAPVGAAETVTNSFTDLVRTGVIERDWLNYFGPIFAGLFVNPSEVAKSAPATPARPRPLSDYVGTYANAYAGDVVVAQVGASLTVTLGPKKLTAPLKPYDGDVFSWYPPGGNGDPISAVTFAGGGGGRATTMTLEFLQMGKFTRRI